MSLIKLAESTALDCGYTIAAIPKSASIIVCGYSEQDVANEFSATLKMALGSMPLHSSIHWILHPVQESPTDAEPRHFIRCEIGMTS